MTSIPGVFAGGDCGNDKISIAVEAIADAHKAAVSHRCLSQRRSRSAMKNLTLSNGMTSPKRPLKTERECADRDGDQLTPEERKDNFTKWYTDGFTEDQAVAEASRCLECGCHDYYECKLIDFANEYDVHPERLAGDKTPDRIRGQPSVHRKRSEQMYPLWSLRESLRRGHGRRRSGTGTQRI